jgi:hypothetical protein
MVKSMVIKIGLIDTTTKPLNHNRMKQYRVWLEDAVEEEGGFWWYCLLDDNGCLYDENYPNEERDTIQWYIDNDYKVEEVI